MTATDTLTPDEQTAAEEISRLLAPPAQPQSATARARDRQPGTAGPGTLARFVTFAVQSPEWKANTAACRACEHFRPGQPKTCALTGRQPSTHAIEGTCPTGRQPNRATGVPAPKPPKTAEPPIAFGSNVGREKPRPGEPRDFPIDLVVPWVDGSDPAWRAKFRQHVKGSPDGSRYASADELKYLLRSIERFAPWIRTIWILTDKQRPSWLKTSDRVRVVDHHDFIPAEYLPTFSSATIEMHIHRIDGLAEHFLYGNDDCFFGNTVAPSDFFTADGKAIQTLGGSLRASGSGTYAAMRNNAANALDSLFGKKRWRQAWHQIAPCRRSALAQMADRLADLYAETSRFKTRRQKSIATNNGAWPLYQIESGFGVEVVPAKKLRASYINAGHVKDRQRFNRIIEAMPHLLCVNNASAGTGGQVKAAMEAYFPEPTASRSVVSRLRSDHPPVIPPIMHFVWLGSELPDWAARNIERAKELHRDWDVHVYREVPESMPSSLKAAVDACSMYCLISDIIRWWAIFEQGGIYVDTDVVLTRSLEPLRKLDPFVSESHDSRPYCAVTGSPAKHPVVRRLLDHIEATHRVHGRPPHRGDYGPNNCHLHRDSLMMLPRHLFYSVPPKQKAAGFRFLALSHREQVEMWRRQAWPESVEPFGLHVFGLEVPGQGRSSFAKTGPEHVE